ncbi:glycine zipper 2TM domain-containing protein [soil metagenome]
MNSDLNPAPLNSTGAVAAPSTPHRGPRALWAAIAVLAVAVIAMGGVLLKQQSPGGFTGSATPAASNLASTQPAPNDGILPPLTTTPLPAVTTAAPSVPSQPNATAPMVAGAAPQSAPLAQPAPAIAPAAPPAPLCTVCGHVESVRTVQREQPTSGVGAVAGGVVGGVVGNQIGHGGGRTAATVLGAVGGGFLGNHIERRTHTMTRYEVTVRMDDGSRRTVETRTAPPIGKDVTLKGQVLRPANRHL